MPVRSAALVLTRVALGVLLAISGALKIGHAPALAASIAAFRILPGSVIAPLALALPLLEIFLGIYLLIGLFTRVAATIAAVQFALYAAAIASVVLRGITADCGCFGPADRAPADWPHVAFDLGLALGAIFVAYFAPGPLTFDRRLSK